MSSKSTPTAAPKSGKPSGRIDPPDQRFWQRYSPHHELPMSSVSSVVIHALLLGLLIFIGIRVAMSGDTPLAMEPIAIGEGGGGGSPEGEGSGPGSGVPPAPSKEMVQPKAEVQAAVPPPKEDLPTDVKAPPVKLPDSNSDRVLEKENSNFSGLHKLSEDTQRKILDGLTAGKGEGGTGSGGGKGSGFGPGEGSGIGPGKGQMNVRKKRLLRWTLIFSTQNGEDYREQLISLGAILAIPEPSGGYTVVRDLRHVPVRGRQEDLDKMNRIFWIDDKPQSVGALSAALGIPPPQHIVAFFPQQLEAELLRKELRYRNRREEDIQETKFDVERRGDHYVPVVSDQR